LILKVVGLGATQSIDEINESKQLDLWNDITDVFKNYYDK